MVHHVSCPSLASIGQETAGGRVSIGSGWRLGFDWQLAAEASEVEDGGQEGRCDGGGQRDPTEEMSQAL